MAYLQESEIYKEPDISVAYVAKATGISSIIISQSINTLLGKNFFNLINGCCWTGVRINIPSNR